VETENWYCLIHNKVVIGISLQVPYLPVNLVA